MQTRREFFTTSAGVIGAVALAPMIEGQARAETFESTTLSRQVLKQRVGPYRHVFNGEDAVFGLGGACYVEFSKNHGSWNVPYFQSLEHEDIDLMYTLNQSVPLKHQISVMGGLDLKDLALGIRLMRESIGFPNANYNIITHQQRWKDIVNEVPSPSKKWQVGPFRYHVSKLPEGNIWVFEGCPRNAVYILPPAQIAGSRVEITHLPDLGLAVSKHTVRIVVC